MKSGLSADRSLTEHTRRMNSLCRLCGEHVKRGEKDRIRSKGTHDTPYSDKMLLIFGINIVKDTDHKHSSAINHQLPEKKPVACKEQLSVNLVKEHT